MIRQADFIETLRTAYKIHFFDDGSKKHCFKGSDLSRGEGLLELLNLVGAHLQAPHVKVAASLFAKYYSHLVIAGGLFAAVRHKFYVDLSLYSLRLYTHDEWSPSLHLAEAKLPSLQDTLDSLFERNLRPLFGLLSQIGSIQERSLWSHASYSVRYLHDLWVAEAESEEEKQHLQQVFTRFIAETPELQIGFDEIPHPLFPETSFRLRETCCLRYCLPEAGNCTTCPKLSEEERVESLRVYHGL